MIDKNLEADNGVGRCDVKERFIYLNYPSYSVIITRTKELEKLEESWINAESKNEDSIYNTDNALFEHARGRDLEYTLQNERLQELYNEFLYDGGMVDEIRKVFQDFAWSETFKRMVSLHIGHYGSQIISGLQRNESLNSNIFTPLEFDVRSSTHMLEDLLDTSSSFSLGKDLPPFDMPFSSVINHVTIEGIIQVTNCDLKKMFQYSNCSSMAKELESLSRELHWFTSGYLMAEKKCKEAISRFRYLNQAEINTYLYKKLPDVEKDVIKQKIKECHPMEQMQKRTELLIPFEEAFFDKLVMTVPLWQFIKANMLAEQRLGYQELQFCMEQFHGASFHGTLIKDLVSAAEARGLSLME